VNIELIGKIVYPALKAGQPMWLDENAAMSSPESYVVQTPEADEDDESNGEDFESEEEEFLPPTSARGKGVKSK
jgi:hypothetical protein